MDFDWTEAQRDAYSTVSTLARRLDQREQQERWDPAAWRECGDFGLLGLSVDEAHGGLGYDALTTAAALEGFGRGCRDTGLGFSAAAHLFACAMPLCERGSDELVARFVPGLCSGDIVGANAITEPEAGSDVFALRTTAERDGDDYVLSGVKSYVTNGPVAGLVLTYAVTDRSAGYMGISAFAIPGDTPGLRAGDAFATAGLRSSPISAVYLEDCRVPAALRVGDEGQGARIFTESMQWERSCLFALYVGAMERQLESGIEHARERRQFRKPIGRNQAVRHRFADMKLRLEAARLLLYRACWRRDRDRDASLDVAMAKVAVSEAAIRSALDAVQLHGGGGFSTETGVEAGLRDALPATIFSGTSEIQRDVIARELGL